MKIMEMFQIARLAANHLTQQTTPEYPVVPVQMPTAPIYLIDGKMDMKEPKVFYDELKRTVTGSLNSEQVSVVNKVMKYANHWRVSWLAYALATTWHESCFKLVEEIGKGRGRPYHKPGKYGQGQWGRGLPQLTWDRNYEWADKALGLNGALLKNFNLALDADISAKLMVLGMETGAFTGKGLRNYLTGPIGTYEQFRQARRIINGMDKADMIARYAVKIQQAIIDGRWAD